VTAPPAETDEFDLLTALLATGLTYKQAGDKAGVCEATVYRRMKDPTFRGRVDELRQAAAKQVYNRVVSRLDDAAESLHLMATDAPDPADRIRAASALLDHFLKLGDRLELEGRIARLEAMTVGPSNPPLSGVPQATSTEEPR
jgi:hypothetical protein